MLKRLLVVAAIFALSACKQTHLDIFPKLDDPAKMHQPLSVEQMSQDIDALIEGVLEYHPDLAKYTNVEKLKERGDALKRELTQPMTRTDFFKVVGKLNADFKDGHSFLLWPYQEYSQLRDKQSTFPFQVTLTADERLVLSHTYRYKDMTLNAGDAIQEINGIDTASLINSMQLYVGGESSLLRKHIVAQRFPIMLWAVTGVAGDMQLVVGDHHVQLNTNQEWASDNIEETEYYYEALNGDTGYLYIDHFDIEPSEFEDFVDTTFAQIAKDGIENLIVDIRQNMGGNTDTVTYLARHLANKPFRLVSAVKEKLNQHNRGWFNYKGEAGEIVSTDWDDWERPIDNDNHFDGTVYVLIGPVTYSAAIVFATTMQDHGFATLVGESTGGYANQSAQGNLFNLPHSQLRAYVTTRLLVRPSGEQNRQPVVPEHVVSQTQRDIKHEQDKALENVLTMIESQRK